MDSQIERLKAIVLRRTNYGEADRVVQLITPKGRRSVMAKGVRRQKSKLAGGIELLAVSDVVIRSGRGELGILTSAKMVAFYRHILQDYERLQFAYDALKLVSRASETLDEPEWYDILVSALEFLDRKSISQKLTETWFYVKYADMLGEELNLSRDVAGQELDEGTTYMYDQTEKALRKSEQGDITADHIKFMRLVKAKTLAQVAQIGGVEDILDDCWLMARQQAGV